MSIALEGDCSTIARFRLRGPCEDPLLARLRAATALAPLTLAPPGLPPAALLVVRQLRDPLPGRLRFHRPGDGVPPPWERAVREGLDDLHARARRPAREPAPESAEAVLFANHGELLACLARDWLHGDLGRWWWRTLYPAGDLDDAAMRAWCERTDCVPAALADMARTGDHVAWVARLTAPTTRWLLQSVIERHGLDALAAALANAPDTRATLDTASAIATSRPSPVAIAAAAPDAAPPWRDWLPDAVAAPLGPAAEALLGVSLAIVAAPQAVRDSSFARQVRRWLAAAVTRDLSTMLAGHKAKAETAPALIDSRDEAVLAHAGDPHDAHETPIGSTLSVPAPEGATPDPPDTRPRTDTEEPIASVAPMPWSTRIGRPVEEAAPETQEDDALTPAITTRHGGLFFLINLGLFLDLYADFTRPRQPGIPLPLWDFVALVGRDLLGHRGHDDPVWALLARLAGRSAGQPPGHRFQPEDDWRAPLAWLTGVGATTDANAHVTRGRLQVRAGDLTLVDVHLRGRRACTPLCRELRPYVARGTVRRSLLRPLIRSLSAGHTTFTAGTPRTTLEVWTRHVFPLLRRRLLLAMGATRAGDSLRSLIERPARVHVSPTRLDVCLSLADLPIAVRLSGLDRDPGWVPAAGRAVHFHFD